MAKLRYLAWESDPQATTATGGGPTSAAGATTTRCPCAASACSTSSWAASSCMATAPSLAFTVGTSPLGPATASTSQAVPVASHCSPCATAWRPATTANIKRHSCTAAITPACSSFTPAFQGTEAKGAFPAAKASCQKAEGTGRRQPSSPKHSHYWQWRQCQQQQQRGQGSSRLVSKQCGQYVIWRWLRRGQHAIWRWPPSQHSSKVRWQARPARSPEAAAAGKAGSAGSCWGSCWGSRWGSCWGIREGCAWCACSTSWAEGPEAAAKEPREQGQKQGAGSQGCPEGKEGGSQQAGLYPSAAVPQVAAVGLIVYSASVETPPQVISMAKGCMCLQNLL